LPRGRSLKGLQAAAERVRFSPGETLFREGEGADRLWLVGSGWVRLQRAVPGGPLLALDIVTARDWFCGLNAFFGGRYIATAVAARPVEGVALPASLLKPLMRTHLSLAVFVAGKLALRYRRANEAYGMAFAPVEQRVASVLLRLEEDFGPVLPVTRREVAELAGIAVETAIRVTGSFQRGGLIRTGRGRVELLSRAALLDKVSGS